MLRMLTLSKWTEVVLETEITKTKTPGTKQEAIMVDKITIIIITTTILKITTM